MQGIWECSYDTEICKQNRANKLSIHKSYSFCSVRKCIKNIILYIGVLCYVVDVINMDLNVNLLMRKLYMIYIYKKKPFLIKYKSNLKIFNDSLNIHLKYFVGHRKKNRSDRSMELQLPTFFGNYNRQSDQRTREVTIIQL